MKLRYALLGLFISISHPVVAANNSTCDVVLQKVIDLQAQLQSFQSEIDTDISIAVSALPQIIAMVQGLITNSTASASAGMDQMSSFENEVEGQIGDAQTALDTIGAISIANMVFSGVAMITSSVALFLSYKIHKQKYQSL